MSAPARAVGARATREAAWILAGRVAFGLAGIVGLRIQTAVMDADLFGRFAQVFGGISLLSGALLSPLGHAQNHFLHDAVREGSGASLLRLVLRRTTTLTLLGFVLSVPLVLWTWGSGAETAWILLTGGLTLLAGNFRDRQHGAFNTYRWRGRYALLAAVDAWLRPLLIAAAVLALGPSVRSAMLGLAAGAVGIALMGWPWWNALEGELASAGGMAPFEPTRLWRYALPYFGVFAFTWVSSVSDRYVVAYFAGASEAGRYVAGYQIGGAAPMLLASAFFPIFSPLILQASAVRRRPVPLDAVLLLYAALGLLLAGVVVVQPDAAASVLVSRREFMSGDEIVPWVLLGVLLLGLQQVVEHQAYVTQRSIGLLAVSGSVAAFNLAMNLCLVPVMGARAAAWNTAATYLLNLLLTVRVYRPQVSPRTWLRVLALGASAVSLVAAARIVPLPVSGFEAFLVRAGMFAVAFVVTAGVVAAGPLREGYREMQGLSPGAPGSGQGAR